ncbi:hypothetical protein TNCV_190731 [Trichonephila clavipes]|nr:hypothetical protein TNCV_190731 [Trichonephila clavipes]
MLSTSLWILGALVFSSTQLGEDMQALPWIFPFKSMIQLVSKVPYKIQFRTLSRSLQSVHLTVIIPIYGAPRITTSGVVTLKETMFQPINFPLYKKHIVVQKRTIGVDIEFAMNWDQRSESLPRETSLDHNCTPPNFNVSTMHSDQSLYPDIRQNQTLPSNWLILNLDPSLKRTCFHSSKAQF